jgi:hypothetical protein
MSIVFSEKIHKMKNKTLHFLIHYMHSVYCVATSLVAFLSHAISNVSVAFVQCSSGRRGDLYKKFIWHCTVGINVTWVTQHSLWSSPLSPGFPSEKTHLLFAVWGQMAENCEIFNSSDWYSPLFECYEYLAHFWCASKLVIYSALRWLCEFFSSVLFGQGTYVINWHSIVYQELIIRFCISVEQPFN